MPKSPAQKDGSAGNAKTRASVISVVNDIVRLAQEFLEIAPDPETVKSLQMARSQLNTARLCMNDNGSRLPEKEQIAPNQLSWPPTAARMGVKRGEKRRRGKVDSELTAEHIGVPKRKRPCDDPYGAGEQSRKHAKPDAVSAAANARAPAMYSPMQFPVPPVPYSQPTYAFQYPHSQPAHSLYPVPMFSPYTFPPA